ncbi:hypothetical protein DOY81_000145 [Sarcophaga bullata]|nr:hypothetical protein DOY81_000145 [Sarcophaga bullata]
MYGHLARRQRFVHFPRNQIQNNTQKTVTKANERSDGGKQKIK